MGTEACIVLNREHNDENRTLGFKCIGRFCKEVLCIFVHLIDCDDYSVTPGDEVSEQLYISLLSFSLPMTSNTYAMF